jgi:hypothetical protein
MSWHEQQEQAQEVEPVALGANEPPRGHVFVVTGRRSLTGASSTDAAFVAWLDGLVDPHTIRFGGAIGWDTRALQLAFEWRLDRRRGWPRLQVITPATIEDLSYTARETARLCADEIIELKGNLRDHGVFQERNEAMLDGRLGTFGSSFGAPAIGVFAALGHDAEAKRGGTYNCVRSAIVRGVPVTSAVIRTP